MDTGAWWAAVHGVAKSQTRLHFHFSLSCIGEGNGNPLQCSCLENPRDRGAWWAAVYGVAQSQTRLKRLSSSSSILQVRLSQFPKATETGFELRQPKSRVCGPTHLASIGVDLSFPEVPFSSFLSSAPTLLQELPGFLMGLFFNLQTDMINLMTLYQQS